MKREGYELLENYMLDCMRDSAHDKEHIYRVLYTALDIAGHESGVDYDVLIAACLLHDVGRQEQFADPSLDHAAVGAEKAERFLLENGFSLDFSRRVVACIRAHRFRSSAPPRVLEEKILFDADKVDVAGALGIARTILYQGEVGTPLYAVDEEGRILATAEGPDSFFKEYKHKLEGLYGQFLTERGAELAAQRQRAAVSFYASILEETVPSYGAGRELLSKYVD